MILNSILQLLDPLSQLVDLTLPNSEKKNRKTKRITQNPSNRRQRRTQDKKNGIRSNHEIVSAFSVVEYKIRWDTFCR